MYIKSFSLPYMSWTLDTAFLNRYADSFAVILLAKCNSVCFRGKLLKSNISYKMEP